MCIPPRDRQGVGFSRGNGRGLVLQCRSTEPADGAVGAMRIGISRGVRDWFVFVARQARKIGLGPVPSGQITWPDAAGGGGRLEERLKASPCHRKACRDEDKNVRRCAGWKAVVSSQDRGRGPPRTGLQLSEGGARRAAGLPRLRREEDLLPAKPAALG